MGTRLLPDAAEERARLCALLASRDLAWLVELVRARCARGVPLTGPARLLTATPSQRAALTALLGRPAGRGGTAVAVRLEEVDALLRTSGAQPGGLAAAVVAALDGAGSTGLVVLPETGAALADGPADGTDLAGRVEDVLALLPTDGVLLADLAEATTGDPGALDAGPLAAAVLRAVRELAGVPATADDDAAWAAVGVVRDEVAATVTALRLPVEPVGPTGTALAAWAAVGQPAVLTVRQLRLHPPVWRRAPSGGAVLLCITSAELAALAGASAAPPAVWAPDPPPPAVALVLSALRRAGWELRR